MVNTNLSELYMTYRWQNDTYTTDFPEILGLELQLLAHDIDGGLILQGVEDVAAWGTAYVIQAEQMDRNSFCNPTLFCC